jgi:hypothetical protein
MNQPNKPLAAHLSHWIRWVGWAIGMKTAAILRKALYIKGLRQYQKISHNSAIGA